MNQWLLPENAEDIFPKKAAVIESKKRLLIDLYLKKWISTHFSFYA